MLSFCGTDKCLLDGNGRLKFSPEVLADFGGPGMGVVMRCLPEGCIAVYPETYFQKMRRGSGADSASLTASSVLYRRQLRALNASSSAVTISPQGRITLPEDFRKHAGVDQLPDVMVVGIEVGVEIWSLPRWKEEEALLNAHYAARDELEMKGDLESLGGNLEKEVMK